MGKLSKKEGFKVPEAYFEGLSGEIMAKLNTADLPESEGFKAPDGYFDSLGKEVLAREHASTVKVIKLASYKKYLYAAASVAAVVLLVFGWPWQAKQGIDFGDIGSGELEAYFDDNTKGLSTYEIAEVFPVEDLELNDILERNLDDENIVDYLDANIDDIDELNLNNDE
jgi:hypothetical protein